MAHLITEQPSRHTISRFKLPVRQRCLAVIVLLFLAAAGSWFFFQPGNKPVPGNLPPPDQREIVSLLHRYTLSHGMRALRSGDFRLFVRTLFISRKQRVSRFMDNHDGTYRVYTVVDDPKETDGWYAWTRHYIQKTNGQWVILRSY